MDWKIELIYVPVTDVDRAKDFYVKIGFNADHDQVPFDGLRFVQMTPPDPRARSRSASASGNDLEPGKQNTIQVVVPDADQALADLRSVGVDAAGVDEQAWGRFVSFDDPDGNTWTLQELPARD